MSWAAGFRRSALRDECRGGRIIQSLSGVFEGVGNRIRFGWWGRWWESCSS